MADKVKVKKGWPIAQRGKDMEQAIKQQTAADNMNKLKIELLKKKKGC